MRCGANPSQHRLNRCEAQCSEVHEIVLEAAGFLSRPAAFFFPFFHLRPVIDSSTMVFFTQDSGL